MKNLTEAAAARLEAIKKSVEEGHAVVDENGVFEMASLTREATLADRELVEAGLLVKVADANTSTSTFAKYRLPAEETCAPGLGRLDRCHGSLPYDEAQEMVDVVADSSRPDKTDLILSHLWDLCYHEGNMTGARVRAWAEMTTPCEPMTDLVFVDEVRFGEALVREARMVANETFQSGDWLMSPDDLPF